MSNVNPFWNNADFLPQFKAIGQSLKRRFFRKPNVADAISQYEALCQDLQREEQEEFAAICCLEAAKCQETLQSPIQQANLLVKGATMLMQAKDSSKSFEPDTVFSNVQKYGRVSQGHVQLAIQSFQQAAALFLVQKHYGMGVILTMQVAEILCLQNDYGDALKCYRKAYDVAKENFTICDQLVIMDHILKCKVKLGEYESASKSVQELLLMLNQRKEEIPPQFWSHYITSFEIMRVCLILITGANTTDLLQFIWPESSTHTANDESERKVVLVKLKSLVIAVQHCSNIEVLAVRSSLGHMLNQTHQELFATLLQMQG